MNVQAGWYDAGVQGRERWWDGTQWTAHERDIVSVAPSPSPSPAPVAPVQQQFVQPQVAAPQQQYVQSQYAVAPQLPPMGWYPVPSKADVRWWDGAGWTPYRIRDGKPKPDFFAVEPPSVGLVIGILFLVLGLMQFSLSMVSRGGIVNITSVLFVVAGVIWLVGGIHGGQVRKLPAPETAPVFDPAARPLPGEAEGVGAGWYPVSGQISRWWTGTRWSWYVAQKFGVRPGHAGPRGYLITMIMGWILVGIGILGLIFAIAMTGALGVAGGILIGMFAVILGLLGGLILLMTHLRRYTMILPTQAPPLR